MKKKHKKLMTNWLLVIIPTLFASLLIYFMGIYQFPEAEAKTDYKEGVVKIEKPVELTMREWVLNEIKNAGLNVNEADCVIWSESSWDINGWLINKDGKSVDQGLWAINSKWHPEVSHECAFSYKCSTKEAIRIRKENGNWDAWYGYKNGNCKRFK